VANLPHGYRVDVINVSVAGVGMTDLVAALRWVQDNIANFGGDPGCVMIYGQSGGGSKVTTLLGMPLAEGLIHRASAQSGGGGNPPSGEQSREFARQVITELGVKDTASLQKMEWAHADPDAREVATVRGCSSFPLSSPPSSPRRKARP
jgi:para-nitrobenzyl esterase